MCNKNNNNLFLKKRRRRRSDDTQLQLIHFYFSEGTVVHIYIYILDLKNRRKTEGKKINLQIQRNISNNQHNTQRKQER